MILKFLDEVFEQNLRSNDLNRPSNISLWGICC